MPVDRARAVCERQTFFSVLMQRGQLADSEEILDDFGKECIGLATNCTFKDRD